MKAINTNTELIDQIRKSNLSPVGFVPTMGALHKGHISLVEIAMNQCPIVVVSIFVNPTQFNDKNDLRNYPRSLDIDLAYLDLKIRRGDIVFTPGEKEIYPQEDKREFHFGNLDNVMEAVHRPGHFNGVAQVVSRLFEIVKPDIAVFGMKDFQQLAVIRELMRQIKSNVKIIPGPIVREADGLAMSSRNILLDSESRKLAPVIFKTLTLVSEMVGKSDVPETKIFVENSINNTPGFRIEYFEIVDEFELIPVNTIKEMKSNIQYYGCIAVKAGNIRLIDNIKIELV
jgi:pantoate--beta-alanine ligase